MSDVKLRIPALESHYHAAIEASEKGDLIKAHQINIECLERMAAWEPQNSILRRRAQWSVSVLQKQIKDCNPKATAV